MVSLMPIAAVDELINGITLIHIERRVGWNVILTRNAR